MEKWIHEAKITVSDDLASKTKLELGEKNFYLIWTMKHAMRWLQEKEPQFHPRLEKILGKNYIQYFQEKSNKSAIPR
jgi:hypothetical protein